jgi:hypothetical protein
VAKRRSGLWPKWFLRVVAVPVAILGIVAVYALANVTDSTFARLSAPLELVILVAVLAVVCVGRRFLARDFAALDLERVRSATPRSGGNDVSAASRPAGELRSERDRRTARRSPGETTALAAYVEARAAFADVIASIETQVATDLEPNTQRFVATDIEVKHSQFSLTESMDGLSQAVRHVTQMCEVLAERIESDRLERRALADAVMALTQRALPSASTGPRLLGSTVFAIAAPPNRDRVAIVDGNVARSHVP